MDTMNFRFEGRAKTLTYALMGLGVVALISGFLTDDSHGHQRFWANMLVNGFFFLTIDDAEAFLCNNGGRLVSLGAPVGFCSTVYERSTWRAPWLCCSALCLLTVDSRSRWYFVDC